MAQIVEWNDVCSQGNKKYDSDEILRVKPGCNLKVRLISKSMRLVKVFTKNQKCIIVDNEDTGRQLKEEYPNKIKNVSVRYASWCIDRDSGEMKILDFPQTVARKFSNRIVILGKKISGVEEGCDWTITTNGKKGIEVRYDTVCLEETPLTDEEKEMVKSKMADKDSFDLTKKFEAYSFEDAKKKLFFM